MYAFQYYIQISNLRMLLTIENILHHAHSAFSPSRNYKSRACGVALYLLISLLTVPTFASPSPQTPRHKVVPSANLVVVEDEVGIYDIGQSIEMLEDPSGELTFDDVSNINMTHKFISDGRQVKNASLRETVFWYRWAITPKQDAGTQIEWLLKIAYFPLHYIDIYLPDENGTYYQKQSGSLRKSSRNEFDSRHFIFKLDSFLDKPYTVYVKVNQKGPVIFYAQVMTYQKFVSFTTFDSVSLGAVYGILFVMALYNLFIFFSVKESSYLFYVCYIFLTLLTIASLDGFIQQMFFHDYPVIKTECIFYFLVFTLFAAFNFVKRFLETEKNLPKANLILNGGIALCIIVLLIGLAVGNILKLLIGISLLVYTCICILVTAFISMRKGVRAARFFFPAWIILLLSASYTAVCFGGYIPTTSLSFYGVHIGAILEVLLLSVALADRINSIQHEKDLIEKRAETLLKSSNMELASSLKAKEQFLTTISHELRTPMNGIVGALDMIEATQPSPDQIEYLSILNRSSRDMLGMIESILDFTELESGDFRLNKNAFSVRQLIYELNIRYRGLSFAKGLRFLTEIDSTVPEYLKGDVIRLSQLLSHLIGNAIKFTDQGEVVLSMKVDGIVIDNSNANDKKDDNSNNKTSLCAIQFDVRDTGKGIPQEWQEEIFDSFYQVDSSNTRSFGGLGIGLAVCKNIVAEMNGTLTLESNENKGSVFKLHIEFESVKQNEIPVNEDVDSSASKPNKYSEQQIVMVVEDNPVNQAVLIAMLKKTGCGTLLASTGLEAVEILQTRPVSLVLMDCQMPVMDGFEATRNIRKLENENINVPIVAVTANAMSKDRDHCLSVGMNDYVKKPISRAVVQSILFKWLGG